LFPIIRNSNSDISTQTIDDLVALKRSESYHAATVMAISQFNLRDSSIVPELARLSNCSVYFELPFFSRRSTENNAVRALWELTKNQEPCVVLGPLDLQSAQQIQDLCTGMGFPLINQFETIDPEQENSFSFFNGIPMTVKTQAMMEFIQDRIGLNIWQSSNAQISHLIRESAEKRGMTVEIFSDQGKQENTRNDLLSMKRNGIKTIFLSLNKPSGLVNIAIYLDELSMLTSEYMYILSPEAAPPDVFSLVNVDQHMNSAFSKLLARSLVFDQVDHFLLHPDESKFLKAWREQQGLLPTIENDYQFFQKHNPLAGASFVYDAIMSVGIGKCYEQGVQNNPFVESHDQRQDITWVPELEFHGASGEMQYVRIGRHYARVSNKLTVGIYSISPCTRDEPKSANAALFKSNLVSTWTESTGWESVGEKKFQLPVQAVDQNFLSSYTRTVGSVVTVLIWLTCCACFRLLSKLKNEPQIRRSQSFYLKTICLASMLTSTSILSISWDEGTGFSDAQLDIACMTAPWFFFLGQIIAVTAIFIKLWRVHQVVQFRYAITVCGNIKSQVFIPLALTVIFLFLWSILDPFMWNRQMVSTFPPESYGQCISDHFAVFFALLGGVICYCNILTLLFAWITRVSVPKEFRDHKSIIFSLALQLQTWLLASVTLSFLSDSKQVNLIYACRIVTVIILSLTNVLALVVPRLRRTKKNNKTVKKRVPELMEENHFLCEESQDEQTGPTSPASASADRTHGNESGDPASTPPLHDVEKNPMLNFVYEKCDSDNNDDDAEWLRYISCFSLDSIPPPVSTIEFLDNILLEL
jgi:hypothetical protein